MLPRALALALPLALAPLAVPPSATAAPDSRATLASPTGKLALTFDLAADGGPRYALSMGTREVLRPSRLGLTFKSAPGMDSGFVVDRIDRGSTDETWEPVWGETRRIRNRYNELAVTLRQPDAGDRRLVIRFRLFDDGLGFRYEIPEQKGTSYLTLIGERTEFVLTGDHTAFWMPGDFDTNEYKYATTRLSEVNAYAGMSAEDIATRTVIAPNAVQTPLMMRTADGLYVNIHEAALVDYPAMALLVDKQRHALSAVLAPDAVGNRAYLLAPAKSPWRTVIVSGRAADVLASKVVLNLNEPSKITDTSWIRPQKYVGIWWELHVAKTTWKYADVPAVRIGETDFSKLTPIGYHGATTENTKRYIDFAARHGFDGVLVEGWNIGWEDWYGNWKENVFDFVTPYPDFDVEELARYAASKGVKVIMHHETSGSATNYERRMDDAFRFMKAHGYDTVKTGYVGRIIPRGELHDGQWMVNHYVRVAEKAATYAIMVNAHEPVRPTGLHRTWPNWLACEAARGNEFNAWSEGSPPEHETILPFTRLMGGPMDYTPGIFQVTMSHYDPKKSERIHTTLAKQLALYVTIYSPFQMAADLPENYERFPDAFQFIKDVAVDWDDTWIVEAEPGDYVTIARKARGRDAWFAGAIADENARTARVPLGFLPPGREFVATIYADAADAHWERNPMAYRIERRTVDARTVLELPLAPGGGAAVSITPKR